MTTDPYFLAPGSHRTAADGRCAMEFVAYLAGEPHSDKPACVSPVLRDFCVAFNDVLPDDERQRLRPYLARTIGTAGDGRDKERGWLCTDWLVRVCVPAWLDLTGLTVLAARLRALPEIASQQALRRAKRVLAEARSQASAAARDSAEGTAGAAAASAAGAAAWDAARAAAGAAAWDAARAAAWAVGWVAWLAWDAARAAALAAAGHAARDAGATAWIAGDAAWDALRPTVVELHRSTFDLLDRMLPTEPLALPTLETANWELVPVGAR